MDTRLFAQDDPRGFLAGLPDGAILDEIQQAPELPSYIQTLVDETQQNGQFILTGSQQFEVATTVNQSLAGRTAVLKLLPFSIEELGPHQKDTSLDELLLTGFYPRIWREGLSPAQALANYIETYVERDIRQLVAIRDLILFPVEIKSGMTVNKDYFKGLRAFARVFDIPLGAGLVYGGEERQERQNTTLLPAREFHTLLASKEDVR